MSFFKKHNKKNYLIIGLGRSGFWAAKLLQNLGNKVLVIDESNNRELSNSQKLLEKDGVKVILDKPFLYDEISPYLPNLNYVILSPTISLANDTVKKLRKQKIILLGEIDIGWQYLKNINWVGITGTNGKTTVTDLLSHILSENHLIAPAAGNIGIPICKYAYDLYKDKKNIDWLITELSSYQIEITDELKPKIGIWTTFTSDHLERHKNLENYFNIKNKLLKNSQIRIYNYDDKNLRNSSQKLSKGIWVTSSSDSLTRKNCDYWIDKEGYVNEKGKKLFDTKFFNLKGEHNLQNLLLASAAARKIGLTGDNISNALLNYRNLPHRLETIFKNRKFEIINDSKATNFDSSIVGINSIKTSKIIISGGRKKEGDYKTWAKTIFQKCNSIFLFGESAYELESLLNKEDFKIRIYCFKNLSDLIDKVLIHAKREKVNTILFSPACSSFDQFKNYEERGNYFKFLVNEAITKNETLLD